MTQLDRNPSYLLIEDQLDAIGQKYRVQRLVRGAMLFVAGALVATAAAAIVAHLLRQSSWTWAVFGLWVGWLVWSFALWIVRPLFIRPRAVAIARLIEDRIPGLHNGLTNSVLLARAGDLQDSPWLPIIFDEILQSSRSKSLDQAVKLSDLRGLAIWVGCIALPLLGLLAVPGVRRAFGHGWSQMLRPNADVPTRGTVELRDVRYSKTLIIGQPLEIAIIARDSAGRAPQATLVFDAGKGMTNSPPLEPTLDDEKPDEKLLRYSYRMDRVEQSLRFRIEVGGTESEWYDVNVVRQVKLQQIGLVITPPTYTRQERREITLKPAELEKTLLAVPEGSRIEVTASVDVPTTGALLQVNDAEPAPMEISAGGLRFSGKTAMMQDLQVAILLKEGDQIISRLPDPPLVIKCIKDSPPTVEMKWPASDISVSPDQELKIQAVLRDDYGVALGRVLMATGGDQALTQVHEKPINQSAAEFSYVLTIPANLRKHGSSIRVQVEAVDNRRIGFVASTSTTGPSKDLGPQTTSSAIYEIKFRDAKEIAKDEKEQTDKLRAILRDMLERQQKLHTQTTAWKPADKSTMPAVHTGQTQLRDLMVSTADEKSLFEQDTKVVQKTLLMLALNPAKEAIDLAKSIQTEAAEKEQAKLHGDLQARQRRIISVLESLLAMLNMSPDPTTRPTSRESGHLAADEREAYKKLANELKDFIKEEQRILDQTATLAKKPVDNYDDKDKKLMEELALAQEKMDAFMQEKVTDFSKLAEQDMANSSLLKELMEVYSEVTMAKNALKDKAAEIAVPLEENGLELAKEISSNLEKWLMDKPDRQAWKMEEPVGKTDTPMAELPKEIEDMVGELMEQQEDLFEEVEDATSSWADSLDKGAGWDAADGPIANMSAKGVTGNQLPNDNEMNGRAGEGRSGKSSGEMVEETASGKGGRNTPTRLDPTPFQKGEVKDESKDPTGGATGGGKMSGQGGQGLEGPLAPKQKEDLMKRLTSKQAQLRNQAERLNLQYQVGKYDNFKLLESIALMRRVESDLKANRYDNALRRKDVTLDNMAESRLLLGGQMHVQHDSTPQTSQKTKEEINDAMKGQLPAAWSEALKEYYRKLSKE